MEHTHSNVAVSKNNMPGTILIAIVGSIGLLLFVGSGIYGLITILTESLR